MQNAIDHSDYSDRVFDRILQVARTIAELEEQENITSDHISEANSIKKIIQFNSLIKIFFLTNRNNF